MHKLIDKAYFTSFRPTYTLCYLQKVPAYLMDSFHFVHFPRPLFIFDRVAMTLVHLKPTGAWTKQWTMPTAAPLSGWTIWNNQPLGRNNPGTGNRFEATSCLRIKFRNWSNRFETGWRRTKNARIMDLVHGPDIVMDTNKVMWALCAWKLYVNMCKWNKRADTHKAICLSHLSTLQ